MIDYIFYSWTTPPPLGSSREILSGYAIRGIHNDAYIQTHWRFGDRQKVFIGRSQVK